MNKKEYARIVREINSPSFGICVSDNYEINHGVMTLGRVNDSGVEITYGIDGVARHISFAEKVCYCLDLREALIKKGVPITDSLSLQELLAQLDTEKSNLETVIFRVTKLSKSEHE